MAEGWTRALKGDRLEPYSAGIAPIGIDPRAAAVMREAGVDIAGQYSKSVQELADAGFDYVVTVCDNARERCPVFPGRTRLVHVGFDDPPMLTRGVADEAKALGTYRRVRDEIRAFVERLPDVLDGHVVE